MQKLIQKVKEDMDKKGITREALHKKSGVPKTVITDGILTGKTVEMKFDTFLKLVPHIYETHLEQNEIVDEFMLRCKYELNTRKSLCFCLCAGKMNIIDKLIAKHVNNVALKKYLNIYKEIRVCAQKSIDFKRLSKKIDDESFGISNECAILVNILNDLCMYESYDIQKMKMYTEKMKEALGKVEDRFLKEMLTVFYQLRCAYIDLHHNQLESSRNLCRLVLNFSIELPSLKSSALCCIGESFMFLDKFKSEAYLIKAIRYLEEHGISIESKKYHNFQTTLAFCYIINGWNLNKIDFRYIAPSEMGLFEGLYRDREKGIIMLEAMISEHPHNPYLCFYLAYIKNDITGLYKALELFIERGNSHYGIAVRRVIEAFEEVKN